MTAKSLITTMIWLGPASGIKNALLRRMGHDVHPTARARASLVWKVGVFRMAAGSRMGRFNLVKNMRSVELGTGASVGRMNLVSAHPVYIKLWESSARLRLENNATITSRHSLDCSGGVSIGRFAGLFGHRSTIMSHSIDLRRDAQTALPVEIGARSFVGTNCLILGGASLPERSVLGAGSVLVKRRTLDAPGLYAGVPAKRVGDVEGAWFERSSTHTKRVYIPDTDQIDEDAF